MVEDGLAIIFTVFYFCLVLFLTLFPKKKLGIVNLLFGLIGIIVGCASYALADFPFAPFSNIGMVVLSVLCIAVGDKELL